MSNCCASSSNTNNYPRQHICPVNGRRYSAVLPLTIINHINEPWNWRHKEQGYYFCDDPSCNVVYFGQDDSTIEKSALRTSVGIKEKSDHALVCYCFGVTKKDAASNKVIKEFVMQKTKGNFCACETRNPSGRCCLKYFPKS